MPELVCGTQDRAAWLAARSLGVTATDIVTILGLNSHDSVYSLWLRKQGQLPERPDSPRLRLGRILESHIVELWDEESGDGYFMGPGALYRNVDRPWQMATHDASLYHEDDPAAETRIEPLECKSWADADRAAWRDGPPNAVRVQALWQMDVLGAARGHVAVLFLPSGEFESFTLEHDGNYHAGGKREGCIACGDQALMRLAGKDFYERMQGEMPPPSVDGSAATLAALKARWPQPVKAQEAELDPDLRDRWLLHKEQAKGHEQTAKMLEACMRDEAGNAGVYTVDGVPFARRERFTAQVKAHERVTDRLMPVKAREGNDDD
jgi:putative phage-type endonuclease